MNERDRYEREYDVYGLGRIPEDPEALEFFLQDVAGDRLATPKYGHLERVVLITENGVGVYECCESQIEESFRLDEQGEWVYKAQIYYWLRHPGGMLGLAGRWKEEELIPEKG